MPRIAWFSPIHKSSFSRSAILSAEVVPLLLKRCWDVELFLDDRGYKSRADIESEYPELVGRTYSYLRAFERDRVQPFDAMIYHLEDAEDVRYSQIALGMAPNWAVLHDSHLLYDPRLKPSLGRTKLFSVFDSGRSSLIRGDYPQAGLEVLEMPMRVKHGIVRQAALREQCGFDVDGPIVGCFGASLEENHCMSVLEALALSSERLSDLNPGLNFCWLVTSAAEQELAEYWLSRSCFASEAIHGNESSSNLVRAKMCVRMVSDRVELAQCMGCFDAGVSLVSVTRASFGIRPFVIQGFGAGLPMVVSDCGAAEDLPESVVLKVGLGVSEIPTIAKFLERILTDAEFKDALQTSILGYVRDVLYPEAVVADLESSFLAHREELAEGLGQWRGQVDAAKVDLWRRSGADIGERLREICGV